MLEELKDEIPDFDAFQSKLRGWIGNLEMDLTSIRDKIFDHIMGAMGLLDEEGMDSEDADSEDFRSATVTAYCAFDLVLDELPVDRPNADRLIDFLNQGENHYDGFRVLLTNFRNILTDEEYEGWLSLASNNLRSRINQKLVMTAATSNPLPLALDQILHGSDKSTNPNVILLDYHDLETFSDLWLCDLESPEVTIGKQPKRQRRIDLIDSTKQYLLIGSDPPDGIFENDIPSLRGINFRSHFTATSWLAAWKVRFSPTDEEKKNGAKESLTRIAVIDPRSAGMAQGAARALQTIFSARDAAGHSLVPGATVLNAPSLTAICQWLKPTKADTRTVANDTPHLRNLLKSTIWNELISNREEHHALSNVLGAFLLSNQVSKGESHDGDPWVQDYMLSLIQALGVNANLEQMKLKEHTGFQRWITTRQQKEIEGVVLIDDMADLWSFFLRGATGFIANEMFDPNSKRTYRESFDCFGGAHFREEIVRLPERLGKFLESDKRRLRAADLLGGPSKSGENFVLFLDLRLFATTDVALASDYDEELRSLGKQILVASRLSRPWLDAGTFSSLEEELDGVGGHPRETLLPRLISLLDPTLPIVIFSSSHRTELISPFRNYGNIIVDFRKPVLTGMSDWSAVVRETYSDFHSAMTAATGILTTRRFLAKLEPVETIAV